MHQRTLLTTLSFGFSPPQLQLKIRPKKCQCTTLTRPALCTCSPPQLQLKTRPKTCQCTKEPFLLPFPSVFLPHNRNYRPKTCQCTKDPFLHFMVRFPICFTRISKVGKCIAFQLWTPTFFKINQKVHNFCLKIP